MNALSWPKATLPLTDVVHLIVPFSIEEASPDEAMELLPLFEKAMREADPSVRSVSAIVRRDAVMTDFLGRTILVYPLALQLAVRLSTDVLPGERTRRQAQLLRGIMRAASRPEKP